MYVLITPARNEEDYIEMTIKSVISQTLLPEKWIIVSDGSTDRTDGIVLKYENRYNFIQLLRAERLNKRNFGSKVLAINAAYTLLQNLNYDYIGFMDADITVESDYYERVIRGLNMNPRLGISGGLIYEYQNSRFKKLNYNLDSVAGAVQMFKKKCYEDIGGYKCLEKGGIDAVAEVMARMNGWIVRTNPDLKAYHHRQIGASKVNIFFGRFRYGQREYFMGTYPLFFVAKCIDRLREKPRIIGSILMIAGFLYSSIFKAKSRHLPTGFIHYVHREQKERLSELIKNRRIR